MKRINVFTGIAILTGLIFLLISCSDNNPVNSEEEQEISSITDIDGNIYDVIKIGDQYWTANNLMTTRFNNGDEINHAVNKSGWSDNDGSRWAYYNYNSGMKNPNGYYYNWYTVADSRGLCPQGSKVPDYNDWKQLYDFTKGEADLLKSRNGWVDNLNGTDQFGFNGYPGGYKQAVKDGGEFGYMGRLADWWSSSEDDWAESIDLPGKAGIGFRFYGDGSMAYMFTLKDTGRPVRCILE